MQRRTKAETLTLQERDELYRLRAAAKGGDVDAQHTRLQCLNLAAGAAVTMNEVLALAEKYYDWVVKVV